MGRSGCFSVLGSFSCVASKACAARIALENDRNFKKSGVGTKFGDLLLNSLVNIITQTVP